MTGCRGWGWRVCALMVPVVVGLTGCAGSGAAGADASSLAPVVVPTVVGSLPGPGGSSSASRTASAATAVAAPSMMVGDVVEGIPAEARVRTAKGAEAFVRYYLDVLNDVMQHPRIARLEPLALTGCKSCSALAKQNAQHLAQGSKYATTPLTMKYVGGADGVPEKDPSYRVIAVARQNAATVVDASGSVLESVEAKSPSFSFEIKWSRAWRVSEIRVVAGTQK